MQDIKVTYPYKTHHIELPGNCNITYIDEGKGERTLLFIHGLANYALVWKKNIDYLKQYYRCIALDLPGNGLSDQNTHPFTMPFFADTVHHFIEKLGLDKLCIVGHSMGGQVAITTLLRHSSCAEALVLCAPAGIEHFTAMEKAMYYSTMHIFDFMQSEENVLVQSINSSFFSSPGQANTIIKDLTGILRGFKPNHYKKMTEACIKSMLEDAVTDKLATIKTPVLLLFGTKDALIPNKILHHTTTEAIAKDAVKKLPNARLTMIPDCGHFVQWEKSEEVNREIIMFLEEKQ